MSLWTESLKKAASSRNDEFYTSREDVAAELDNYDLSDKVVYCNCDTHDSEFYKYFCEQGKCRKLLCTGLGNPHESLDGDFRKELQYLKEADVVVTNPPFSKIQDFLKLLLEYRKDFIIIGPLTMMQLKIIRGDIMSGRIHSGFLYKHHMNFFNPRTGTAYHFGNCMFYTTLPVHHEPRSSDVKYDPKTAEFTNDGALFIRRSRDIPCDYSGIMAVPISFFMWMDWNRFEMLHPSVKPKVGDRNAFSRMYIRLRTPAAAQGEKAE